MGALVVQACVCFLTFSHRFTNSFLQISISLHSQTTGEPSKYSVIAVVVPCVITPNYHPVMVILLLESTITAFTFSGYWVSSTSFVETVTPSIGISRAWVVAPIAGLGEQQVDSGSLVAD